MYVYHIFLATTQNMCLVFKACFELTSIFIEWMSFINVMQKKAHKFHSLNNNIQTNVWKSEKKRRGKKSIKATYT